MDTYENMVRREHGIIWNDANAVYIEPRITSVCFCLSGTFSNKGHGIRGSVDALVL